MNNNGNDNPAQVSNEDLLRFLDAGPKVLRWPRSGELARESFEPQASRPGCPLPESYMNLAAGSVEESEAEKLLTHAADCDACGDILALNLSALEGDPSAEETAAIAELAAARMEWQQRVARELAATRARKRPILPHSVRWTAAAAAAAVLVLAAGLFAWRRQANTADHQLAMAYEQSRTLELRVPEAGFAPLKSSGHTRGVLNDRKPATLLDAQARLTRDLERSPQDARLLELQARADILEERYDSAAEALDRLLAQGPVTADLLADAASAYYQRGLVSSSELDRSTALDYLRRADAMAPADPVVLFNEAIVMEDRGQMMNAVEVWNRYLTVERDPKWLAEGKRKLAALEQTLNRLKTHQSRIEKLMATPQAMDALSADAPRLATLDEELSSYELDKLLLIAYPLPGDHAQNSQQARGSPCEASCRAARKLLKAIASSLEIQHHDSWLTDLLLPDIDTLPAASAETYALAMQSLAHGVREDETGVAATGEQAALKAQTLFRQFGSEQPSNPAVASAAHAGEERAGVEYLFALQRVMDFRGCRALAGQFRADSGNSRYPWIEAQAGVTEKVCDDTPESRVEGRARAMSALSLSDSHNYRLMSARIHLMLCGDALDSGDEETGERLVMNTLRDLYAADTPPIRIANAIAALAEVEQDSPLTRRNEGSLHESVLWFELANSHTEAARMRMNLAHVELEIGATKEAENQIRLAHQEVDPQVSGGTAPTTFAEAEIRLAGSMLAKGNLSQAGIYLDQAGAVLKNATDDWTLRPYVAAQGMLELKLGHFDQAARILESEIRNSEGSDVRRGDKATNAEFAQLDHELYAELAATWLAQGRSPESVLGLWERFRLRSRGLPITQCLRGALDCEQPRVAAARGDLEDNLLIGQIILLDRVLVYRVDSKGVSWSSSVCQRQEVLDAAKTLENAISSPLTTTATAERLGARLSEVLLPPLPEKLNVDASLLLEPDPLLQNLSWPVLPAAAGPLGLQYSLAEMRSILAIVPSHTENGLASNSGSDDRSRSLIVGASEAAGEEPPLPEALQEAKTIAGFLHAPQLLLGEQANAARVAALLDSAAIFHFAGHAVQTYQGTELLLAASAPGDKHPWVDGAFLRQHPPRACRLAVLSACATGAREASWNHPMQDIVETLGAVGVPEVVATRWQISSDSAVPFMEAFYRNLSRGTNAAMALTLARRLQFVRTHENNPYYWGAYYVSCTDRANRRKSHGGKSS